MVMIPILLLLVASASARISVNVEGPKLNVQADGSGIGLPSAIGTGVAQSLGSSLQSLVGKVQGGITNGLTTALAHTAGGAKALEINGEIVASMLANGFSREQIEERMRGLMSEIKNAGADVDKITGAITDFAKDNGVENVLQKYANELSAAVHKFASRHNVTEAEEKAREYVKEHGSLGNALSAAKEDGKEIVANGQTAWNLGGARGILNYAQNVLQRMGLGNITDRLINRARNLLENLMSPKNIARFANMAIMGMGIPPPFSSILANTLSQALGGEVQLGGSLGLGQGLNAFTSIINGVNGQLGLPSISGNLGGALAGLNGGLTSSLAGLGAGLNSDLASSVDDRLNAGLGSSLNAALTQGGRLANQATGGAGISMTGRPTASWNMGRPSFSVNLNGQGNGGERERGQAGIDLNLGGGRQAAASGNVGHGSGSGFGLGGNSLLGQMTQAAGQMAGGLVGAASDVASMGMRIPTIGIWG